MSVTQIVKYIFIGCFVFVLTSQVVRHVDEIRWILPLAVIMMFAGLIIVMVIKHRKKNKASTGADNRTSKPKKDGGSKWWPWLMAVLCLTLMVKCGQDHVNHEFAVAKVKAEAAAKVERVKVNWTNTVRILHIRLPDGKYDKYGNNKYEFPIMSFSEGAKVLNFTFTERRGISFIQTLCILERRQDRYYGKYNQMDERGERGTLELERVRETGKRAWTGTLIGPEHQWELWIDEVIKPELKQ